MSLSSKEFKLMQKFIEEQCGLALGEDKSYLIETRLSKILIDSGMTSFEQFYENITARPDKFVVEKVIDAITTHETLWFRDGYPWIILEEVLLPKYVKEIREGTRNKVKIWSAACSSGQEPYSIAMCIDNYLKRNGISDVRLSQFEILATDISSAILQIANPGRYDNISIMRGLDSKYKDQYFIDEGKFWSLEPKIKSAVKFQHFNLQNSFILLGKFDIIFCRYVVIYFSSDFRGEVMSKIAASMENGGVLFLGSSEIFSDYNKNFDMKEHKNGVYYVIKG